ncbi:MAG TPA: DUF397 domain-containing protein [Mycobacterium sp.]|nr:DUF397 domain-containing protein [Mycobacterium sp.]
MTNVPACWRKSSRSGQATNCVEVRNDLAAVQDTKNRGLVIAGDVRTLVAAIQAGRLG